MRVVALVAIILVIGLLLVPAYGNEPTEFAKKTKAPAGMADVIITGASVQAAKAKMVQGGKELSTAASIKSVEPDVQVLSEYKAINGIHAYVPTSSVADLQRMGYTIEENKIYYTQLDSSGPVIKAATARRLGLDGNGTKVCVIDSGIDLRHTQLQIPPPSRVADFINRIDGPANPGTNGTTHSYTVYVNETQSQLNFSINWVYSANRFDFEVKDQNGTVLGSTAGQTPYLDTYWWMTVNLTNVPAGYYNITTNDTVIVTSGGEYLSLFWDPYYPYAGIIPSDYNGHGTHVAGTITGNNTTYQGTAQGVTLYVVSACGGWGQASCSENSLLNGMQWCLDQGVDIISMSLGGTANAECNDTLTIMTDVTSNSLLNVIAAGNSGSGAGSIQTPGCARKALAVGNVYDTGTIRSDSSRGPTGDGRIKPEVTAPGNNITSTYPVNTFTSMGGTSMATPHVAGIAAIAKQANPTWTPFILKAALMATANKSNGGNHLDNDYGAGLVEAPALANMSHYEIDSGINVTTIHRGEPFSAYSTWRTSLIGYATVNASNNTNSTVNVVVPINTTSLKAVLYWEENATDSRSYTYLYLINTSGAIADNSTIPKSTAQMVYVSNPPSGAWKLNVSAKNTTKNTTIVFYAMRLHDNAYAYAEYNISGNATNFTAFFNNTWANLTNTTDNDWSVGVHTIRFFSNNTFGRWSYTATSSFTLKGWAGINESANVQSANEDTGFSCACRVRDSNTTIPISGYNVSFWANGYLGSNLSDSNGWANITAVVADPGTYVLTCNITNASTLYYDAAESANLTNITINQVIPPATPSGGGGGGAAIAAAPPAPSIVYLNDQFTTASMYKGNFSANDGAVYNFAGQNRTITVIDVTENAAVLGVMGQYNITLAAGQSRNLDLDGDSSVDMTVTLNGIANWAADIAFAKPAAAAPPQNKTNGNESTVKTVAEEPQNDMAIIAGILVLVGAVAIAVILKLRLLNGIKR